MEVIVIIILQMYFYTLSYIDNSAVISNSDNNYFENLALL